MFNFAIPIRRVSWVKIRHYFVIIHVKAILCCCILELLCLSPVLTVFGLTCVYCIGEECSNKILSIIVYRLKACMVYRNFENNAIYVEFENCRSIILHEMVRLWHTLLKNLILLWNKWQKVWKWTADGIKRWIDFQQF